MKTKVTVVIDLDIEEDEDLTTAEIRTRVLSEAKAFVAEFAEILCDNQGIYVDKHKGSTTVE